MLTIEKKTFQFIFQSPLDLTPTYSGTMYGLCNGFGALSGMICPLVATALTAADPYDLSGWRTLFLLGTALYVISWFFYVAFVKVKPLPFDPRSKNQPLETSREAENCAK